MYRCGCVVQSPKQLGSRPNATIEFPLGRQKQLEVRLISEKSLDGLGRLKSHNAMETSSKRSAKDDTKVRLRKGSRLKLKQSEG